jgi:hypothetical protein
MHQIPHPARSCWWSAKDCCEASHTPCLIPGSESPRHAKTLLCHHFKHSHHANNCVATSPGSRRPKRTCLRILFNSRRRSKSRGLRYGIQFTQVQEDVEDVWAVGILLQGLEMIEARPSGSRVQHNWSGTVLLLNRFCKLRARIEF